MTKGNSSLRRRVTKRQAGVHHWLPRADRGDHSAGHQAPVTNTAFSPKQPSAETDVATERRTIARRVSPDSRTMPWPGLSSSKTSPSSRRRKTSVNERNPHWRPPRQAGNITRGWGGGSEDDAIRPLGKHGDRSGGWRGHVPSCEGSRGGDGVGGHDMPGVRRAHPWMG